MAKNVNSNTVFSSVKSVPLTQLQNLEKAYNKLITAQPKFSVIQPITNNTNVKPDIKAFYNKTLCDEFVLYMNQILKFV